MDETHLHPTTVRILDIIDETRAAHHSCTMTHVARQMHMHVSTIQERLAKMSKHGLVTYDVGYPGSLRTLRATSAPAGSPGSDSTPAEAQSDGAPTPPPSTPPRTDQATPAEPATPAAAAPDDLVERLAESLERPAASPSTPPSPATAPDPAGTRETQIRRGRSLAAAAQKKERTPAQKAAIQRAQAAAAEKRAQRAAAAGH